MWMQMSVNENSAIQEMAELLAKQKLVPFLGAGVSRSHRGPDAEGYFRRFLIWAAVFAVIWTVGIALDLAA
jgi:hypothetical protein